MSQANPVAAAVVRARRAVTCSAFIVFEALALASLVVTKPLVRTLDHGVGFVRSRGDGDPSSTPKVG